MATPTFAPSLPLVAATPSAQAAVFAATSGAEAVEVAAMFGDSVVDVKHCANPRSGKVTTATWGFIGGGIAALLLSAGAFASAVSTASTNDAGMKAHVNAGKPAYSYRPAATSGGTSVLAFGGLALALAGISYGVARARREKTNPSYRIGLENFPLVAPKGDDFVFNFGAGIEGEMTVNGTSTPLAALAAAGHATPSLVVANALELPIPSNATIRARVGQTTFLVTPTAKAAAQPASLLGAFDSKFMKYAAGSLAAHLGLWAILQTVPMEDSGLTLDMSTLETTNITAMATTNEDAVPPPVDETGENADAKSDAGGSMTLPAGLIGKPTDQGQRELHMKNNNLDQIQASREEAIEAARGAGIMGSYQAVEDAVGAIRGAYDIENGFNEDSRYGGVYGNDAGQYGQFGQGPRTGHGTGGCYYGNCQGIFGTGPAKTIGDGERAGDDYGGRPGRPGPLKDRTPQVPKPDIGEASCAGSCGLDKKIIRRYILRSIAKIQYCYEHELLADNALAGTVTVKFVIAPDGSVQAAHGSGVNDNVASCVAGVVKNINFPRPDGLVQVNYPFTFRAAGK